jgi:hypothetical protein
MGACNSSHNMFPSAPKTEKNFIADQLLIINNGGSKFANYVLSEIVDFQISGCCPEIDVERYKTTLAERNAVIKLLHDQGWGIRRKRRNFDTTDSYINYLKTEYKFKCKKKKEYSKYIGKKLKKADQLKLDTYTETIHTLKNLINDKNIEQFRHATNDDDIEVSRNVRVVPYVEINTPSATPRTSRETTPMVSPRTHSHPHPTHPIVPKINLDAIDSINGRNVSKQHTPKGTNTPIGSPRQDTPMTSPRQNNGLIKLQNKLERIDQRVKNIPIYKSESNNNKTIIHVYDLKCDMSEITENDDEPDSDEDDEDKDDDKDEELESQISNNDDNTEISKTKLSSRRNSKSNTNTDDTKDIDDDEADKFKIEISLKGKNSKSKSKSKGNNTPRNKYYTRYFWILYKMQGVFD